MAKQKVYYWRGPGELLGCKPGEKVPTSKLHKAQFEKMVADGRLQETAIEIVEDSTQVSKLQKQVKELSEQLVAKNADTAEIEGPLKEEILGLQRVVADNGTTITELEAKVAKLETEVSDLTADLEAATADTGSGD